MTKLYTATEIDKTDIRLDLQGKTFVLGSCFADDIGSRLKNAGFELCLNPFGTLYNPLSIANSISRLDYGAPFRPEDCVQMGAGAGKICSWWHHTSFARESAGEFLKNANSVLAEASAFWKESGTVIITLGTAMVWKLKSSGEVVSNCLKRPAAEFSHEMLSTDEVSAVISRIISRHPDKQFIFTVSPIRHGGEGMHRNTLSKSTLQLGLDKAISDCGRAYYFPSYEIMLDELRDYRFYADDLVHPSVKAIDIIQEKFFDACTLESDRKSIEENLRKAAAAAHRPMGRR